MKQHCPLILCWTRGTTLILSVSIVILSLYVYHKDTYPVVALFEPHRDRNVLLHDLIENKRLIATLVAAQASIFCPLFLLLQPREHLEEKCRISVLESLMPAGLALSWAFCISFEDRMNLIHSIKPTLISYLEYHLKYVVVAILLIETALIWIYCACSIGEERRIQLPLNHDTVICI